jgi:hypothetical protein
VEEVQSPPLTTHLHLKSQIQAEADKSGGSGDLVRKLKDLGIDLPALLKCLSEHCRSSAANELEARRSQK